MYSLGIGENIFNSYVFLYCYCA